MAYLGLLDKWNRHYNLTAVTDPHQMLVRHLCDSLVLLPLIQGPEVVDVGTGAGLPGIPLSIMQPQNRYCLVDSSAKKVRFLRQVQAELGLQNVQPRQIRVEEFDPGEKFDTVVTRAFAPIQQVIEKCMPLRREGGRLLAMIGKREAVRSITSSGLKYDILPLSVPGLTAERHVVQFL